MNEKQPSTDQLRIAEEINNRIKETGISPDEMATAEAAQKAAQQTVEAAIKFVIYQMQAGSPVKEKQEKPQGITLITPYGKNKLRNAGQLLKNKGINFQEDLLPFEVHKRHLLSAMVFASQLGVSQQEVLKAFGDYISQEKKPIII